MRESETTRGSLDLRGGCARCGDVGMLAASTCRGSRGSRAYRRAGGGRGWHGGPREGRLPRYGSARPGDRRRVGCRARIRRPRRRASLSCGGMQGRMVFRKHPGGLPGRHLSDQPGRTGWAPGLMDHPVSRGNAREMVLNRRRRLRGSPARRPADRAVSGAPDDRRLPADRPRHIRRPAEAGAGVAGGT